MNTEQFVREEFAKYYATHRIAAPHSISAREFGFGNWEKKIEYRHLSFPSEAALGSYLAKMAPLYISYSAALYRFPAARPIEKKEWLGAELVFDIDIHCTHSKWFTCEKCLEYAKDKALTLVEDFLVTDFGVDEKDIQVNFTGNRGYHVHVTGFENIGGYARKEIADYVSGKGIEPEDFFFDGKKATGPKATDGGWRGKIAKEVLAAIDERRMDKMVGKRLAIKFYTESARESIRTGNWAAVYIRNWKNVAARIIENVTKNIGCPIDESVTMDITKLIRLPDSLHGETGFVAKGIESLERLKKFAPLKHAIAFDSSEVKVKVKDCEQFIIGEQTFGPFKEQVVSLPKFAAIYLLCKKVAEIES